MSTAIGYDELQQAGVSCNKVARREKVGAHLVGEDKVIRVSQLVIEAPKFHPVDAVPRCDRLQFVVLLHPPPNPSPVRLCLQSTIAAPPSRIPLFAAPHLQHRPRTQTQSGQTQSGCAAPIQPPTSTAACLLFHTAPNTTQRSRRSRVNEASSTSGAKSSTSATRHLDNGTRGNDIGAT